jgi:hypothetical protein
VFSGILLIYFFYPISLNVITWSENLNRRIPRVNERRILKCTLKIVYENVDLIHVAQDATSAEFFEA